MDKQEHRMNDNRGKRSENSSEKNENQLKQDDRLSKWNEKQPKQKEKQFRMNEIQPDVKEKQLKMGDKQPKMDGKQQKMEEKQPKADEKQPNVDEKQLKVDEKQPKMVEKQPKEPIASASSTLEPTNVDGWPFRKPKYDDIVVENTGRSGVDADSEVYKMDHKRRGVALIFNHVTFKKMPMRTGSVKDCSDLEKVLHDLGFNVRVHPDPTIQTITTVLKSTAAEDHTDADCLVVVAMSHGESGFLHSFDFKYPVEMLWAHFTGDNCSTLIGKPKLFFIQACRGMRLDAGSQVMHESDGVESYSIPTYADIMVAYSTYDGFYSWRNPDAGAWFIQALCKELEKNGRVRDLLTIMTFVNRRVAIDYQSHVPHDKNFHKKKQIPSFVSMLTRLVYFSEQPL